VVRGAGVRLFLSICLPLTAITISVWGIMYGVAHRLARRDGKELGLPGYADEKGLVSDGAESPRQRGSSPGDEKSAAGLGVVMGV